MCQLSHQPHAPFIVMHPTLLWPFEGFETCGVSAQPCQCCRTLILCTWPSKMTAMMGVGGLLGSGAASGAAAAAAAAEVWLTWLLVFRSVLPEPARLLRQSIWYLLLQNRQWVSSLQTVAGMQHRLYVTQLHFVSLSLFWHGCRGLGSPKGIVGKTAAAAKLLLVEPTFRRVRASAHCSL
jgi:hypothetical protein